MARKLEDYVPVVGMDGINTDKDATFGGDVTVEGTLNATGSETLSALPETLGTAGQVLAVNSAGDGLEWVTPE